MTTGTPDKIRAILTENGIDKTADNFADLVSSLLDFVNECEKSAESYGRSEAEDEANATLLSELEAERERLADDLRSFLECVKSDPQSAAVYFHRATGKHLFEVSQPCLL